jgi:hypothetical protein
MSHNLTAIVLTIVTLGIIATFDIIPGAGFYAGLAMLAIGGVALVGQFVMRNGTFLSPGRSTYAPAASTQFAAKGTFWFEPERRSS